MKQYDAVIIGFGKAGKTLAAELAAHDWNNIRYKIRKEENNESN